jgi:translation initiation factor IF-1
LLFFSRHFSQLRRRLLFVAREDLIHVEGTVKEVLAGGQFKVESDKGQIFHAKISGRMRRNHIRVIPGDRVTVAVSPYDPSHGLIVYRSS